MLRSMDTQDRIIIAMTGASGAIYGTSLIRRLARISWHVHLLISDAARIVLQHEQGITLPGGTPEQDAEALSRQLEIPEACLRVHALDDWFAPAASGSGRIRRMIIAPCSMGTLARIAHGVSGNLIERAADVQLKEGGQLLLIPRETPLSVLHLENMTKLARMGATIMPAMPAFYRQPSDLTELVEHFIDRVMHQLGLEAEGGYRWGA